MFDTVVVGKGLIGSAAARYLASLEERPAIIGPDEPPDWQAHQGVFASHYDQGRITRILDDDIVWATLAQHSLASLSLLEQQSGIKFHHPVGGLRISTIPQDPISTAVETVGKQLGAPFAQIDQAGLAKKHPYFHFPASAHILAEHGPAGFINPRSLIRAQPTVARQQGVTVIPETVLTFQKQPGSFLVKTDKRGTYEARKVLIAAGGYTNFLLKRPLALLTRAHSILMAEVSEKERARLANMPAIIYKFPPDPATLISGIYLLPPIRYPDGRLYIKLGGTFNKDNTYFDSQSALVDWFHSPGDLSEKPGLQATLEDVLPGLEVLSYQTKPCILAYTRHNHPYIDCLAEGLYVAAGGCGSAAKSSDEIGRLAAQLTATGEWSAELDASLFQAVYA